MLSVEEMNAMILAADAGMRRRLRSKYRAAHPTVIVMSIKPKYAKAIYEGRKNWEFRKAPPPIYKEIYIYESAPVSKITGRVVFCASVTGTWIDVWEMVKTNKCFTRNLPGIRYEELEDYAGKHDVTALRVFQAERLDHEVTFGAKPPQNWGRFAATYRERQQAYNNKAADPLTPEEELADTIKRQKEAE